MQLPNAMELLINCRNKSNLHSRCGPKLSCIFKVGQAYDVHVVISLVQS